MTQIVIEIIKQKANVTIGIYHYNELCSKIHEYMVNLTLLDYYTLPWLK